MQVNTDFHKAISMAGSNVLSGFLGFNVTVQDQRNQNTPIINEDVTVIIQMLGQVEGKIICSMKLETVKQIVGRMLGGMEVVQLDEMGWSAIQEFGNWFVSGIATEFSNHGLDVNITHPIVNEGRSQIRTQDRFIVVPLKSECGVIDIYASLETA